jgi:hypothetical protein
VLDVEPERACDRRPLLVLLAVEGVLRLGGRSLRVLDLGVHLPPERLMSFEPVVLRPRHLDELDLVKPGHVDVLAVPGVEVVVSHRGPASAVRSRRPTAAGPR